MATITKKEEKIIYSEKLDKYLRSLPYCEHSKVINKLADYCEVSVSIIYNWRSGRTFIKRGYRNLIIEFFQKDIFDIYEK